MSRVLIVDDSGFMRRMLVSIIESGGHEVVGEAENGVEAVTLYKETRPDVVTMDVMMPRMDGLSALESIMTSYPEAVVVMVTANAQSEDAIRAYEAGAAGYILKPFQKEDVLVALRDAVADAAAGED